MNLFHKSSLAMVAITSTMLLATSAQAASPHGVWLRDTSGAHLQVFNCKGGLGMKVVKAKEKENIGKVIMCGAKASGDNKWKGSLLNLEDGKTYSGSVTLKSDKVLKLQGCVLGGLICKTANLTRIK